VLPANERRPRRWQRSPRQVKPARRKRHDVWGRRLWGWCIGGHGIHRKTTPQGGVWHQERRTSFPCLSCLVRRSWSGRQC